jgi:hypothetical protein
MNPHSPDFEELVSQSPDFYDKFQELAKKTEYRRILYFFNNTFISNM